MLSFGEFSRRESAALGLVCTAHLISHIYILPWAPLLAPVTQDLGLSYAELGFAMAAFAVATGIFQPFMGPVVERLGGRLVLIAGLSVNAIAFVLIGFYAYDFWSLVALMILGGIGNSVFHPADYSIITARVENQRIGRAYSAHTFTGHIGFILGPVLTAALEPVYGWRGAMIGIGLMGLAMTAILMASGSMISDRADGRKTAPADNTLIRLISSPAVLMFFAFYALTSIGNVGITHFSVASLGDLYGVEKAAAVVALTAYQVGTLLLVLPGGVLADKTTRYDLTIAAGFCVTALAILLVGTGVLPFWLAALSLITAGAIRGFVEVSRDVAVRHIATDIPVGTVFGFVSTGFLAGQALGSPFYGWILDSYGPAYIFYASGLVHVIAISAVAFNAGARRTHAPAE